MNDQEQKNIRTEYPDFLCYYFRDKPAFTSILEMGLKNAKRFLKENDCEWRAEESYLPYRLEVEAWIKNNL